MWIQQIYLRAKYNVTLDALKPLPNIRTLGYLLNLDNLGRKLVEPVCLIIHWKRLPKFPSKWAWTFLGINFVIGCFECFPLNWECKSRYFAIHWMQIVFDEYHKRDSYPDCKLSYHIWVHKITCFFDPISGRNTLT